MKETSDLGDLEAKFAAFGWHVTRCDGHDLEALRRRWTRLRGVTGKPKVIIADTVKGKGVSFMEPGATRRRASCTGFIRARRRRMTMRAGSRN